MPSSSGFPNGLDVLSAGCAGTAFPISTITHVFSSGGTQTRQFGAPGSTTSSYRAAGDRPVGAARLANQADEALWKAFPGSRCTRPRPTVYAASNDFVGMAANATGDGVFWNTETWARGPDHRSGMGTPGLAAFVARRLLLSIPVLVMASVLHVQAGRGVGRPPGPVQGQRPRPPPCDRAEGEGAPPRPAGAGAIRHLGGGPPAGRLRTHRRRPGRRVPAVAGNERTARLVVPAMLIGIAIAVAIGTVSAARYRSWIDHAGTVLAFVLLSLPVFWLGWAIRRDTGSACRMRWDSASSRSSASAASCRPNRSWRPRGLASPPGPAHAHPRPGRHRGWTRYLRVSVLDSLSADHVRTARAKGLPEWRVVGQHALGTSLVPLTTVAALGFAGLVGGAVIVERIFGLARARSDPPRRPPGS